MRKQEGRRMRRHFAHSLLHSIAQQLHEGEDEGSQGQGAKGSPQGMLQGPHGCALAADEARRAEVPPSNGA